jgi:hypothetical protein
MIRALQCVFPSKQTHFFGYLSNLDSEVIRQLLILTFLAPCLPQKRYKAAPVAANTVTTVAAMAVFLLESMIF